MELRCYGKRLGYVVLGPSLQAIKVADTDKARTETGRQLKRQPGTGPALHSDYRPT